VTTICEGVSNGATRLGRRQSSDARRPRLDYKGSQARAAWLVPRSFHNFSREQTMTHRVCCVVGSDCGGCRAPTPSVVGGGYWGAHDGCPRRRPRSTLGSRLPAALWRPPRACALTHRAERYAMPAEVRGLVLFRSTRNSQGTVRRCLQRRQE